MSLSFHLLSGPGFRTHSHFQIQPGWLFKNQHFPFFQLTPLVLPEGDKAALAVAPPAEPWEQELPATGHQPSHIPKQQWLFVRWMRARSQRDANTARAAAIMLPHTFLHVAGQAGAIEGEHLPQTMGKGLRVKRRREHTRTHALQKPPEQETCVELQATSPG